MLLDANGQVLRIGLHGGWRSPAHVLIAMGVDAAQRPRIAVAGVHQC